MKKFLIGTIFVLAAAIASAQQAQPVIASSVSIPTIVPAMDPITNASASLVGNPGPARYCYWLVANYTVGNTPPTKVRPCITNGPVTLSSTNYDRISFNLPAGANSADILRTSGTGIDQAPQGSCACAVATANSSGTVQDQSNSLSAYTVTTYDPSVLNLGLTNEVVGAGQSHMKLRQGGNLVGDISALANGLADPGANGLVFRSAANTTRPAVLGDVTALGSTGTGNLVLANGPTFTANPTFASQTGTGAVVLANAPTFTGNPTFASQTGSGAVVLAVSPAFTGTPTLNGSNFFTLLNYSTTSVPNSGGATTNVQLLNSYSFGAGNLNVSGKAFRYTAAGTFAAGAATENVTLGISFNGGTSASTQLFLGSFADNTQQNWTLTLDCEATTTGASGVLTCNSTVGRTAAGGTGLTGSAATFYNNLNSAYSSINLTSALSVGVTVQFGTASSSNTAAQTLQQVFGMN